MVLAQAGALARDRAGAAADSVLDLARPEHLRGLQDDGQPSLVRELIDLFHSDSAGHVQRIADAHALLDAELLRARAHRFLSATQNTGAVRLSALCTEIENHARAGRLAEAAPQVAALEAERVAALAALAALRMRF